MMVTYFEETNLITFLIDLWSNIVHSDFVSDIYFFGDEIRDK